MNYCPHCRNIQQIAVYEYKGRQYAAKHKCQVCGNGEQESISVPNPFKNEPSAIHYGNNQNIIKSL